MALCPPALALALAGLLAAEKGDRLLFRDAGADPQRLGAGGSRSGPGHDAGGRALSARAARRKAPALRLASRPGPRLRPGGGPGRGSYRSRLPARPAAL